MVLENCKIDFVNSPKAVFYSGDNVAGTITFKLNKKVEFTDLSFRAKGETKCSWTESESTGNGNDKKSVSYHGSEVNFRTVQSLVAGYPRQKNAVTLEPGDHTFSFSFTLPEYIPSSLEGYYGRIRYSLKVVAIRPMRYDETHRKSFSVISTLDLNKVIPPCSVPKTTEINKGFNFLFSSRGAVNVVVSFPYTGFVPGQTIHLGCNITNASKVLIREIKFKLIQFKTYRVTSPSTREKCDRNKISKYYGKGAKKGENVSYPVAFDVPAVPPTCNSGSLITTTYYIKMTAIAAGVHGNASETMAVEIGTVPLHGSLIPSQNNDNEASSSSSPALNQFSPSAPMDDSQGVLPYPLLPPPSYEESQSSHWMVQAEPDDKGAADHFSPVYPVYNFPPLAQPQTQEKEQTYKIGFNV